jgi:hypothetical protein
MQSGCSPSPMVIQDDDHQLGGGEKQAGLRPLPRPQLQGSSSSGLGRRAGRVGAYLRVGRRLASSSGIRGRRAYSNSVEEASSSHVGEGELLLPGQGATARPPPGRRSCRAQVAAVTGLAEGANSTTRALSAASIVSCSVPGMLAQLALAPPPTLPPTAWSGRGCLSTAWAIVAPRAGRACLRPFPRCRLHWGIVQDVVRREGGVRVLGLSCPHSGTTPPRGG